jgi:hypothetical protein
MEYGVYASPKEFEGETVRAIFFGYEHPCFFKRHLIVAWHGKPRLRSCRVDGLEHTDSGPRSPAIEPSAVTAGSLSDGR